MWSWTRIRRGLGCPAGFTLIEIFVVLMVLGLLLALAMPRYLGSRRIALVAEADNVLQEMKVAGWQHYQQHATWAGVTTGVPLAPNDLFGVAPPGQACWDFGIASATDSQIVLRARANTSARIICGLLPAGATVDLTLNGDGSSSRAQAGL